MKKFLYVIIGLIVLYVILACIGPSHFKIEKKITINKPSELVKKHTGNYRFFHDKWSPWTVLDPKMTTNYSGNAGEVGHRYEWSGNSDVRSGAMEITAYSGDSINQKMSFGKGHDTKTYYIVSDNNGNTDFTWGIEMDVPFMYRPVMLFTDMGMNKHFETGLNNLKKVMEEMAEEKTETTYNISETNWDDVTYVGKKETVPFDKMQEFFSKYLSAVFDELEKQKIKPLSGPSAIYTLYDEAGRKAEVAAVAKVPNGTKLKGFETFTFPASKVLETVYYGDYSNIGPAHYAMDSYMKEKNVAQGGIVEEYITDPMSEKDTSKWQTNIYYILK